MSVVPLQRFMRARQPNATDEEIMEFIGKTYNFDVHDYGFLYDSSPDEWGIELRDNILGKDSFRVGRREAIHSFDSAAIARLRQELVFESVVIQALQNRKDWILKNQDHLISSAPPESTGYVDIDIAKYSAAPPLSYYATKSAEETMEILKLAPSLAPYNHSTSAAQSTFTKIDPSTPPINTTAKPIVVGVSKDMFIDTLYVKGAKCSFCGNGTIGRMSNRLAIGCDSCGYQYMNGVEIDAKWKE